MSKRKPKLIDAADSLKHWAADLSKATDLPEDADVPRSALGLAATVPALAASLHRLAKLLEALADGGPWWEVFASGSLDQPRGAPRTFEAKAKRYHILCAQGASPAVAAKAVGSTVATMKRHRKEHLQIAMIEAVSTLIDGTPPRLTQAQADAYLNKNKRLRRARFN